MAVWSDVMLARLKQRKLAQWALAYLAGAWLLLQVADVVGERFGWSPAVMRALIILLGIGFFAVLIIAWYHGERGVQRVSGPELLTLTALFVIAGGVFAFVGDEQPSPGNVATSSPQKTEPTADRPDYQASVAVLPFDDFGGVEDDYFSEGITEEIISELAKVKELKVISRTSVVAVKNSRLTLPQIADTLGVPARRRRFCAARWQPRQGDGAAHRSRERHTSLGGQLRE
ncbi:MAG: hypothetical protein ACT4O1_00245 [Gemmatimonadota bacterium]